MEVLRIKVSGALRLADRIMFKNDNGKKIIRMLLALAVSAMLFSGCRGIELENKAEQIEEYSREQAMILIANERNRYEKAYSDGIWELSAEEGKTFDRTVIESVKDFMERLKLLCMMAEERGISLSSSERELIKEMTDAYMESLSKADLDYIGCSRDDVLKIYTDYFTACRLTDELTAVADTAISDSEVKVMKIMQIATEDEKKAKAILKKLKIDKSDFNSLASRYSEADQIVLTLKKGYGGGLMEKTAFSLDEGQISNILSIGGMYYIIKVTDGYDQEATLQRKNGIKTALDTLAFNEVMQPFEAEHTIVFFDKFWSEIDFSEKNDSETDSFFDIYRKIKGEK